MRFAPLIACAAVAPLLIAAENPVRLQPTSPWAVDYAENSCRLVRVFGADKTLTRLAFESAAPGSMDMLVFGRPLQTWDEKVSARLLPRGVDVGDGKVVRTTGGDDVPGVLWSNVWMLPPEAEKAEEQKSRDETETRVRPDRVSVAEQERLKAQRHELAAATTEIAIETRRNHPVILETGPLGNAVAAFDKCSRDSLKDWGVDPAVEDQIVRPVWATNPNDWLFASDYPQELIMRGQESEVAVRLLIDASGKITKCTPLSHFTEAEFTRITCTRIQERARFEPAELADGTKVPSYFIRRVTFRIAQ